MERSPVLNFDPALDIDKMQMREGTSITTDAPRKPPITFASVYLAHSITSDNDISLERQIPIFFLSPALIVGTRGPQQAPGTVQERPPRKLDDSLYESFRAAKESLEVILMAAIRASFLGETTESVDHDVAIRSAPNTIHSTLQSPSLNEIPPHTFIVGIIYDATEVIIVAHIPYPRQPLQLLASYSRTPGTALAEYDFCTYIIDRLPITSEPNDLAKTVVLNRVRLAVALTALQTHILRLTESLERAQWPENIIHRQMEFLKNAYDIDIFDPGLGVDEDDGDDGEDSIWSL